MKIEAKLISFIENDEFGWHKRTMVATHWWKVPDYICKDACYLLINIMLLSHSRAGPDQVYWEAKILIAWLLLDPYYVSPVHHLDQLRKCRNLVGHIE